MKFTKIATVMAALAMLLTSCGGEKTVMTIGDTQITNNDIAFFTDYYYDQNIQNGQDIEYADIRDEVIELFQDAALISEIADIKDIELDEESRKAYYAELASFRTGFGGKKAYDKALEKTGADEDVIEAFFKSSYLKNIISADEEFDVAELNDEELKTYFKENYLRAKHVLISTQEDAETDEKKQAEEILEKAKNGEDFDKLVKEYSEDPGSATNPDGYVFTDGQMVSEFENGTKEIKPGEYNLVKSDFGYHVIKRLPLDESDAKFSEFFEENKDAAASSYQEKKLEENIKAYAEKNGIKVTKDEDAISKMTKPTTLDAYTKPE